MTKSNQAAAKAASTTSQVRAAIREAGKATRQETRAILPQFSAEKIDSAFAELMRQGLIAGHGKVPVSTMDGRTVMASVYVYIGADAREWRASDGQSTLRGVQPRAVRALNSKLAVQRQDSGYEPGHFTALLLAPSKKCPHGFPPRFVPRYVSGPAAVAMSQTIQRRESDSATGKGWGTGQIPLSGTPGQQRPAFMGRLPGVQA